MRRYIDTQGIDGSVTRHIEGSGRTDRATIFGITLLVLGTFILTWCAGVWRFESACVADHRDRVVCEDTAKKIWGIR